MLNSRKSKLLGFAGLLAGSVGLVAGTASAGVAVHKPTPHLNMGGAEFGSTLARAGTFTVAASMQDHVRIAGEATPTYPSTMQGVVYLLRGTNATPQRQYQFPGVRNFALKAGTAVAISNRFLAFATVGEIATNSPFVDSVFIARNSNGYWPECPVVGGQRDCNGSVRENGTTTSRPLTRIRLAHSIGGDQASVKLALSDDNLIISYRDYGKIEFYRYDAATDRWNLEYTHREPVERYAGSAIAIDGDTVAIGVPWSKDATPGVELGSVRIFRRNSSTRLWPITAQAYGHFTAGTFGNRLAMNAGNLAVRAGGPNQLGETGVRESLAFYRVLSDGSLSAPQIWPVAYAHRHLAISGDTLVSTVYGSPDEHAAIYKRDTSTGVWRYETGLHGSFYQSLQVNPGDYGYGGIDPVSISGDDVSLGWRSYSNVPGSYLFGGVIHEKASLFDNCRDPRNLVTNCSFDTVTNTALDGWPSGNGWQLQSYNGASASADYTGRQLRINIQNAGSDMWHIQARTTVKVAQAGDYTIKFRVKADSQRSFVVNLGRNGSADNQWTSYGRLTGTATTQWSTWVYNLPNIPQDSAALLDLNVGNAGTSAITFDSIKLTRNAP